MNPVLNEIIENCGLPKEMITKELSQIILKNGYSEENITLEQMREVMADYIQTVFLELKEELS